MTTSLVSPPSSWTPASSTTPTAASPMPTRSRQPRPVAAGHRDRPEELDGHRRAQRQVLDGDVEDDVHRRQHDPEQGRPAQLAAGPALPPRPPPGQQHDRRHRQPPPGDRCRREAPRTDRPPAPLRVLGEAGGEEQHRCGDPVGDGAPVGMLFGPHRASVSAEPAAVARQIVGRVLGAAACWFASAARGRVGSDSGQIPKNARHVGNPRTCTSQPGRTKFAGSSVRRCSTARSPGRRSTTTVPLST